MSVYGGVGGVVKEIKEFYAGVNGVVHKVSELYSGAGGVTALIYSGGVRLGDIPAGSEVQIYERPCTLFTNAEYNSYIVACHDYVQSGVSLLIRKYLTSDKGTFAIGNSSCNYKNSRMDAACVDASDNGFSAGILSSLVSVPVSWNRADGINSYTVTENRSCFVLSEAEAKKYFSTNAARKACLESKTSTAGIWGTRTIYPIDGSTGSYEVTFKAVSTSGSFAAKSANAAVYIRPAFAFDSDTKFTADYLLG